jgi:hypothetical protein
MVDDQSELERLLVAAASAPDDADAKRHFTNALLRSDVFVLVWPGTQILSVGRAGMTLVAFFSSLATIAEMVARDPDLRACAIQRRACRSLFGWTLEHDSGAVLNPGSAYGKEFTKPELSDLLSGIPTGTSRRVVQHPTPVTIGEPAKTPPPFWKRCGTNASSSGPSSPPRSPGSGIRTASRATCSSS